MTDHEPVSDEERADAINQRALEDRMERDDIAEGDRSRAALEKPGITFKFAAQVYSHGSWGASRATETAVPCEMVFREGDDAGHASIEWIVGENASYGYEEIGLKFEMRAGKRTLIEYDGIMALPAQVISILDQLDIEIPVDEGFDDEVREETLLEGDEIPVRVVAGEPA